MDQRISQVNVCPHCGSSQLTLKSHENAGNIIGAIIGAVIAGFIKRGIIPAIIGGMIGGIIVWSICRLFRYNFCRECGNKSKPAK